MNSSQSNMVIFVKYNHISHHQAAPTNIKLRPSFFHHRLVMCMDHRRTFLLYINALAYVKLRYDSHAQEYTLLLHCAESFRCDNTRRT